MTYSNGQYNPNPLANPFNTRIYGNYSLNSCSPTHVSRLFNSMKRTLPDAVCQYEQHELHTPTADIPLHLTDFQTIVNQYSINKSWHMPSTTNMLNTDDIAYWQYANEKSNELSAHITDEQRSMLDDLHQLFPQSKFEDDI